MAAQAMAAEAPSLNALDIRCCPSPDVPGWEIDAHSFPPCLQQLSHEKFFFFTLTSMLLDAS